MVYPKPLDARLRLLRQGVVRGSHVRELGVGRDLRHHQGGQHRVAAPRVLEGGVGVPEAVREAVEAPAGAGLEELPVRADVRDVGERLVSEAALLEHAAPGLAVKRSVEPGGEGELLVVREPLIPEDDHRVAVHRLADRLEGVLAARLPEVDGAGFGAEGRMQLAKFEGHVSFREEGRARGQDSVPALVRPVPALSRHVHCGAFDPGTPLSNALGHGILGTLVFRAG